MLNNDERALTVKSHIPRTGVIQKWHQFFFVSDPQDDTLLCGLTKDLPEDLNTALSDSSKGSWKAFFSITEHLHEFMEYEVDASDYDEWFDDCPPLICPRCTPLVTN